RMTVGPGVGSAVTGEEDHHRVLVPHAVSQRAQRVDDGSARGLLVVEHGHVGPEAREQLTEALSVAYRVRQRRHASIRIFVDTDDDSVTAPWLGPQLAPLFTEGDDDRALGQEASRPIRGENALGVSAREHQVARATSGNRDGANDQRVLANTR